MISARIQQPRPAGFIPPRRADIPEGGRPADAPVYDTLVFPTHPCGPAEAAMAATIRGRAGKPLVKGGGRPFHQDFKLVSRVSKRLSRPSRPKAPELEPRKKLLPGPPPGRRRV